MNTAMARPPLVRGEDRLIAGVCSGLARHLGMRTDVVRWIMAVAAFLGGAGIVLYGWLWIMVPTAAEAQKRRARTPASPIAPAVSEPAKPASGLAASSPREAPHVPRYAREVLLGVVLLLGAVALGGRSSACRCRWTRSCRSRRYSAARRWHGCSWTRCGGRGSSVGRAPSAGRAGYVWEQGSRSWSRA
ncbi:PspC domain-containing protein [Sinomonas cyclohexanicum]|uniref:PspC domain-containing protein n=1 Tax=Sinomonas cyclohexanicum TaxID=322009 RepID=UPI001E49FB83|nr:PspC domain-containing protein [Corynebacterium cyclohexanicum]